MNELEQRWRERERTENAQAAFPPEPPAPTGEGTSPAPLSEAASPARAKLGQAPPQPASTAPAPVSAAEPPPPPAVTRTIAPPRPPEARIITSSAEDSRPPRPRRWWASERVRLWLAFFVGALCATVAFLVLELVRKETRTSAAPVAVASDTGAPVSPDPNAPPPRADPLGQLFQQMTRGFGQAFGGGGSRGGFTFRFGSDDVDLDVQDEGDAIVVVAKVQGAIEGKFRIRVDGDTFTLTGERQLGSHGSMSFSKSVSLPAPVDSSRMTQSLKDGVLRVRLPKRR